MSKITYYQADPSKQLSTNIYKTKLAGLYYLKIAKHNDERGFFAEIAKLPELEKILGYEFKVKQVNLSKNSLNTVKGMHAEGWNKLVVVTGGLAMSALSDIRPSSPTFKQTEYFQLGFDHDQKYSEALFITKGIANSLCALSEEVYYLYLVDRLYEERQAEDNLSVSIFDPDLKVNWPIPRQKMILSNRDQEAISLKQLLKK